MKRTHTTLLSLGLLALFAVGCGDATTTTPNSSSPTDVTANKPIVEDGNTLETNATVVPGENTNPEENMPTDGQQPAARGENSGGETVDPFNTPETTTPQPAPEANTADPSVTTEIGVAAESAEQQMKQQLTEAKESVSKWAGESKEKLVSETESHLAKIDQKIDELKQNAGELKADSKANFDAQLKTLNEKRDALATRIEDVKSDSGEAWKDLTDGLSRSWAELAVAVDNAGEQFSN